MIKNAKEMPKIYYGLHFYPGVAEYAGEGQVPDRIFIGETTIKNMGPSFSGKPVYVKHVDEVDLENIQNDADGFVWESFFNKSDGKHWVKFMVVSDKGHEAIRKGWRLSNAYVPKEYTVGGLCNGVEYKKEVTRGEYDHLAIVPNPRYEESVILTPEEFKKYNEQKDLELIKLSNSKDSEETKGESSMLFFKKTKVENSADFENTLVQLPKSKVEISLAQLVAEMDVIKNMMGYANDEHMVKVGEEEMSVKNLAKKYSQMMDEKKNAEDAAMAEEEDKKKKNEEEPEPEMQNKKKNEEKPEPELENKKKNELDSKKKEHFDSINNADDAHANDQQRLMLSGDKVALGKSKYGSN